MKDEIKEILDMFIKYKDEWYSCEYILKPKQCVMLLDYITNLEQENERLKENNQAMQEEMAKTWKIADNYKSRIDKAIEHLYKRYEQNNSALTNKEETIISKHELLKLENINNKILEDILEGKNE